ncbi:helix-turn-helix domain-containing protein [Rhizobium ruizarguesonis]|uniref:XRE family transcriptional regulator n=1 Tax=Rhizobium ruizarguesonis TaxID=2081791 RepID=A0AAE8TYL2_9HYPH|nr:XRE family transcriptional regulator [Rhizobium ruizarguesonis]TBF00416.1 XRE family transcriptional regulator [Rhizobium ruizarguesonis]TCA22106.1 XRE family transcriptional regulator [Rhizobium leguminosarum bv. viciae]
MDIEYFIAWRKRQGLTQEQLAEKMLVSLPTGKKWERKARWPALKRASSPSARMQ